MSLVKRRAHKSVDLGFLVFAIEWLPLAAPIRELSGN